MEKTKKTDTPGPKARPRNLILAMISLTTIGLAVFMQETLVGRLSAGALP